MKDEIVEFINREYVVDGSVIDENTPLISSGIVDSFTMVSLKRFLEKKYAITIPDDEATIQAFDTVANVLALVNRHLAQKV